MVLGPKFVNQSARISAGRSEKSGFTNGPRISFRRNYKCSISMADISRMAGLVLFTLIISAELLKVHLNLTSSGFASTSH